MWKALIDFETEQKQYDRVKELYEMLVERASSNAAKVWISYGIWCKETISVEETRRIFERGNEKLKGEVAKAERALLLETWFAMENADSDDEFSSCKHYYLHG